MLIKQNFCAHKKKVSSPGCVDAGGLGLEAVGVDGGRDVGGDVGRHVGGDVGRVRLWLWGWRRVGGGRWLCGGGLCGGEAVDWRDIWLELCAEMVKRVKNS